MNTRRLMLLAPLCLALVACGGETVEQYGSEAAFKLVRKGGCLSCHSMDKKIVGPSWRQIAARYKGKPEAKVELIQSIRVGGKDKWKDLTGGKEMPAIPLTRLKDEQVAELVDFILTL